MSTAFFRTGLGGTTAAGHLSVASNGGATCPAAGGSAFAVSPPSAPTSPVLPAARPPRPEAVPEPAQTYAGIGWRVWTGFEEDAGLRAAWQQLESLAKPANPFLGWEWNAAWVKSQPERLRPRIALAWMADGSPAGLLALRLQRRRGLAQLEFLCQGSGGDELDCLLHPAAPPGTGTLLLRALTLRRDWDLLRMEGLRAGGELERAAPQVLPFRIEGGDWLPFINLPASFEAWLAGQSPNFRSEVRRRRRAFHRSFPQARVECAETPAAVEAALGALYRLHNLRRQQKGDEGIFTTPHLRDFHTVVGSRLAARGASRVYLLCAPEPIAALYGFISGGRFFYFQSGFDPAWSEHSPGTVLLTSVVEDCMARGLTGFEFLRGMESYKARWTRERRRNLTLIAAGSARARVYLRLRDWRRRRRQLPEAAC